MGYSTGVRFTLASGDVDFKKEEINDIIFNPAQDLQVQEHQFGKPYIYTQGDLFNTITIIFNENWSTTRAKIDQILDEDATMTLYYQYSFAPATNVTVILEPSEIRKSYSWGERTKITHTLTFLES